jgi:hypothetical protein
MKHQKNIADERFAACAHGARLLPFSLEAARRVRAGGLFLNFSSFSAGCLFRDDFTSLMSASEPAHLNLTRHEIFRGKVSRRKNQNLNRNCTSKKGRPYIHE